MSWNQVSLISRVVISFVCSALTISKSLAYAELNIALAMVFRRFSLELHETDISDVELAHDMFLPSPKLDSKGVRVKLLNVEE